MNKLQMFFGGILTILSYNYVVSRDATFELVNATPFTARITSVVECVRKTRCPGSVNTFVDKEMPGIGDACRQRLGESIDIAPGNILSFPMVHGALHCSYIGLIEGQLLTPQGSIPIKKTSTQSQDIKIFAADGRDYIRFYIMGSPLTRDYKIGQLIQ